VESEEELARLLEPVHKVVILDGETKAPEGALASRTEN
jgi:hypothetical protein